MSIFQEPTLHFSNVYDFSFYPIQGEDIISDITRTFNKEIDENELCNLETSLPKVTSILHDVLIRAKLPITEDLSIQLMVDINKWQLVNVIKIRIKTKPGASLFPCYIMHIYPKE